MRFLQLLKLDRQEQAKLCKKVLSLDPNSTLLLDWLVGALPPEEAIPYLETRLDGRSPPSLFVNGRARPGH